MFTGIIETIGKVIELTQEDGNLHIVVESSISKELKIDEEEGSWRILFLGADEVYRLVVHKGSICINGVSLTVTKTEDKHVEVAIIPYTFSHTNFKQIKVGDYVNIEYDILGKYIIKNIDKL